MYNTNKKDPHKRAKEFVNKAKGRRNAFVASSRPLYGPAPHGGPAFFSTARGLEVKSVDLANAVYTLNTTALITPINLVRAGSSYFNRIGRRIEMKSCHLKFMLRPKQTIASTDYGRVMLVYDSQTNGAAPAISDVIQDTDQAGTNATSAFSATNLNNRDRFKVLADFRLPLPSITVTAGVQTNIGIIDPIEPMVDLERFVKLRGLPTLYKADSSPAVIGDIATGGLYLITYGGTAAASEGWEIVGTIRLRYKDN